MQVGESGVEFVHRLSGRRLAGRDRHGPGVGVVFRLSEEVRRDELGIPLVGRGRAGDDAVDASDHRGDDGHGRRGDERVAPAGNVDARGFDGDDPLTYPDAGVEHLLEALDVPPLLLVERAHVLDDGVDGPAVLVGNPLARGLDFVVGDADGFALHAVESLGELADGVVTALPDGREDVVDGFGHLVADLDGRSLRLLELLVSHTSPHDRTEYTSPHRPSLTTPPRSDRASRSSPRRCSRSG